MTLLNKKEEGTLSGFAVDGDGRVGLIGCYHTLNNPPGQSVETEVVVPIDGYKTTIVADVVQKNVDPNDTKSVDCAFALLREPMVSEWYLCTGPYRPVNGKIKHSTLVNRWDENETMKFYFRGSKSRKIITATIISCHHTLRHDNKEYYNVLVLRLQEPLSDGDSGALVVTEEGDKAVGIIFARETIANVDRALAASVEDVEKSLQVCLVKRLTKLQYAKDFQNASSQTDHEQ